MSANLLIRITSCSLIAFDHPINIDARQSALAAPRALSYQYRRASKRAAGARTQTFK
jgi:hypothetical protein